MSAHFPWCFRLCAFLLSSSSKKQYFFSLFCHHYLCLTWRFSFSSYHWLYLQVCVCVMCMGKQKNFLYPGRMRKSGIERESWGWMWEAVFWHKLRNVYQAKPFKCQALNFEVHFAPFPIRSSCRKKIVFFSSFRPNSTYEFSFFSYLGQFFFLSLLSHINKRVHENEKKRHQSMACHYNGGCLFK